MDRTGPDRTAMDRLMYGPDRTGPFHLKKWWTGPDRTAITEKSMDRTGPVWTGPVWTGPDRYGPVWTGPDRIDMDRSTTDRKDTDMNITVVSRKFSDINI